MKYKAIRIATVLLHISSSLSKLYELASTGYDLNKNIGKSSASISLFNLWQYKKWASHLSIWIHVERKKCTNKNKIFNISYFKKLFNLLHSISMPFLSDSIEEWLTKNNNGDYSCSRTLDCCINVEAYCVHNRWCIIVHRMRCYKNIIHQYV